MTSIEAVRAAYVAYRVERGHKVTPERAINEFADALEKYIAPFEQEYFKTLRAWDETRNELTSLKRLILPLRLALTKEGDIDPEFLK